MVLMSVLEVSSALFSVLALLVSIAAYRFPWRRRITDHADRLAILEDSMEVIRGLAKRTGARQVKRDQRAAELESEPDWKTDPDGWRTWKQRQIDKARRQH